ncbi:hypothetical protein FACS189476_09780 [Spirochaetia bacterium]|nr:hypothetical protein FACS189476_09780 [Spirochaetia bacterium]
MMIISPQTVSPEIAAIESRQSTVIVERNDRNIEESGETEADRNVFAKILGRLLKNARDDAGLEPGGPAGPELDGEGLYPESSSPTAKNVGKKGPFEKTQAPDESGTVSGLSRNKKSDPQELFKNFPELNEENAFDKRGLFPGLSGKEQKTAPVIEEEIPSDDSEEPWAMALASLQVSGEGDYPAAEGVFGDVSGYLDPGTKDAAGAALAMAPDAKEGAAADTDESRGSLKEARGRKGFRGFVEDVPNFEGGPEKDVLFTGMKKQAPADNEGPRKDRLSDAKNRDKRRDRLLFDVQDLRSAQGTEGGATAVRETGPAGEARPLGSHQETELTVELHQDNRGSEPPAAGAPKTVTQAFEDILARELHQNLNNDIVRQASVVLKDGGEGTIKLSLKPESLGNVKIRLEMADNKITGHIIVESDEALRAFEREVSSLEQAFKESGFEGADLEMSLASGNGDAGEQWREGEASPFFSERFAAERAATQYDVSIERTDTPWAGQADGMKPRNGQISVNMLI